MKRLKIAEQLIIVLVIAVILPLIVTGAVVTNVNQHAVRQELQFSASLIAQNINNRIENIFNQTEQSFSLINKSLEKITTKHSQKSFLNELSKNSDGFNQFELKTHLPVQMIKYSDIIYQDFDNEIYLNLKNNQIIVNQISEFGNLLKYIDISKIEQQLFFDSLASKREIYIIDNKSKKIILSHHKDEVKFNKIISELPKKINIKTPVIFGKLKNQPNVIIKMQEPDWSIIVSTPSNITKYGIKKARSKIIFAIVVAAISIILLAAAYIFSLYINIRQLFKAIKAIEMGNYSRKIRIIKNWLTPWETVFLTNEFNNMAEKIDSSYNELHEKNEKLKAMDEYKSNLIDTVSHELRTPLTSIKGYTSRLLRHDVTIDDETRLKSLKVIKQQAERLGRMVEDLLVVPDIESSTLRVITDDVNIIEALETAILSTNQKNQRVIKQEIDPNISTLWADPDRVEQILINLIDNAIKYSDIDSEIKIEITQNKDFAIIKVKNKCKTIDSDKLNSLFDKFSRIETEMTRTTRGTGLGLFIVKGLVEAMNGQIKLNSYDNVFEASFTIPLKEVHEDDETNTELQKEPVNE